VTLRAADLRFDYPGFRLTVPSLELESHGADGKRGYSVITGLNGSGKTTLARLLCGLLKPACGEIVFDGRRTGSWSIARFSRSCAYVYQNPELMFFTESVADEIEFGLKNAGWQEDAAKKRAKELCRQFGIEHLMGRHPFMLSRGEQQRLAAACVLVLDPPFLFLDEATKGLDHRSRRAFLEILENLEGCHPVLISNEFPVLEGAGRIIALRSGEIVADGGPGMLYTEEFYQKTGLEVPDAIRLAGAFGVEFSPDIEIFSDRIWKAITKKNDGTGKVDYRKKDKERTGERYEANDEKIMKTMAGETGKTEYGKTDGGKTGESGKTEYRKTDGGKTGETGKTEHEKTCVGKKGKPEEVISEAKGEANHGRNVRGKLDPRTRFIMVIILSTTALFAPTLGTTLAVLAAAALLLTASRVNRMEIVRHTRGVPNILFFIFMIQAIFTPGERFALPGAIPLLGGLPTLSLAGTEYGVLFSMKLLAVVLVTVYFNAVTSSSEFLLAAERMRLPYAFAFMVNMVLRFIPRIMEDMGIIMEAQQARGLELSRRNYRRRMRNLVYVLKPVVLSYLLKARRLAMSMEARGFVVGARRTGMAELRMKAVDYAVLIASLLFAAVCLMPGVLRCLTMSIFDGVLSV